ncbi:MAG: hypothetical protein GF317_18865, partial [Candidatus Lokiarchaeota archaeon]|nr:hypothetical protein [Candidatus Lokiarchaeota archaeon]MBD3201580.1 hypothetical protein [Candidatus Lokiarchaeota archaeon]
MDEKKKGTDIDNSERMDEEEYEPTKDAFMADMNDIEEEIASEAYDLVAHALNLVNSGYYDDAIELFYQAIGLYTQINKNEEVNALKEKLEEIKELKTSHVERDVKVENEIPEGHKIDEIEPISESPEEELISDADFEEIEIEDIDKGEKEEEVEEKIVEGKIQSFIESQKKEQEVSEKAYNYMGKAKDLVEANNFDEGIELYQKALELFKGLNWSHEIGELQKLIIRIKQQKEDFLNRLANEREAREKEREAKEKVEEELEWKAELKQNLEETKKGERLKSLEMQKFEEEQFEREIAKLVDKAERLAREYEISRKKALREGKLLESNPYPKIIEIYEDVRKQLLQKGWKQQASIYRNQVQIYQEKLQKDKKLREIEAKKAARQKEIDEMYK